MAVKCIPSHNQSRKSLSPIRDEQRNLQEAAHPSLCQVFKRISRTCAMGEAEMAVVNVNNMLLEIWLGKTNPTFFRRQCCWRWLQDR